MSCYFRFIVPSFPLHQWWTPAAARCGTTEVTRPEARERPQPFATTASCSPPFQAASWPLHFFRSERREGCKSRLQASPTPQHSLQEARDHSPLTLATTNATGFNGALPITTPALSTLDLFRRGCARSRRPLPQPLAPVLRVLVRPLLPLVLHRLLLPLRRHRLLRAHHQPQPLHRRILAAQVRRVRRRLSHRTLAVPVRRLLHKSVLRANQYQLVLL